MQRSTSILAVFVLMALVTSPMLADGHEKATDSATTGYVADFNKDFEGVSKKLLDLAEATPADQFGYAPTEGVRTISQVYIHVALANFFLSQALGVEAPESAGRDAEDTVTAKADVIAMLKLSQEHVRKAVAKAGDDLDTEVELFGGQRSQRAVLMTVAAHSHEHLGQSIAYARAAGVVPPWSR
ncbi:MAG: DinB family protein [Acidobacteriota bacterium]